MTAAIRKIEGANLWVVDLRTPENEKKVVLLIAASIETACECVRAAFDGWLIDGIFGLRGVDGNYFVDSRLVQTITEREV